MTGLDIFILIVYITLLHPILYCLWKHGKPGILAWLPLQSFCILRIVGSILDLHNAAVHSTSEDSLIFNNVGLSPLMLAAAGVLHEARRARNPNGSSKWEWFRIINYHMLIIGSMVLVIIGVTKEINNAPHTPNALMKVGVITLGLSWSILSVYTLLSWYQTPENAAENPAYDDGTTLLFGVFRSLPFIGMREVYALLSVFISNPNFKNNTAAKVVMSVIPEMLVTLLLVFAGIRTRNIGKLRNMNKA